MAKIFLVTPFPNWVEIEDEDRIPGGCLIILILFLLGLIFLDYNL